MSGFYIVRRSLLGALHGQRRLMCCRMCTEARSNADGACLGYSYIRRDTYMKTKAVYPFTAIVGQEEMKKALLLSVVMPSLGGVLIKGE